MLWVLPSQLDRYATLGYTPTGLTRLEGFDQRLFQVRRSTP